MYIKIPFNDKAARAGNSSIEMDVFTSDYIFMVVRAEG